MPEGIGYGTDAAVQDDLFADEAFPAEREDEPMTEEEIGAMLSSEIDDAVSYYDEYLAPDRAEATRRYKGLPYGNEQDGRSQIVARTTRDTVMQVMPSLLRIFTGPRRVVEFEPERPDAEDIARQRTDYVNHVFTKDNPGFRILHDAFKDALIRRYAIFKWWWEDKTSVENETYEGLTEEQVAELATDTSIEDISFEQTETITLPPDADSLTPDAMLPQDPAQPPQAPQPQEIKLYTARVRRVKPTNQARIAIIPGEEFFIDRAATGVHDAKIIGHRRGVSRSDLVAMGYSKDFIEEHEGNGAFAFDYSEEAIARRVDAQYRSVDSNPDNDLSETMYTEVWRDIDRDGDGIAELHKICLFGSHGFVARIETARERPFAIMTPDPEPHEFAGQGFHDILKDLERINTDVTRLTLDSFAFEGKAVARVDGLVAFVSGGVAGDEVRARLTKVKKQFVDSREEP